MKNKKQETFKTLLTLVIACLVFFVITKKSWLLNTALILGFAGLLSERIAKGIDFAWMKFAYLLSFIMPAILLTLVFFLVLFPLSLFSKLFKKHDTLLLSNTIKSTFVVMNKKFTKQSFERPW